MPKQPSKHPELDTWIALNNALRSCDQATAERLLAAEQAGKARKQFLSRIVSRLNKLQTAALREKVLSNL